MLVDKVKTVLSSDTGSILLSAVIGLGFAAFFRKACEGGHCTRYVAEDPKTVAGKTWGFNGACYKYMPHDVQCGTGAYKHRVKPAPKDVVAV
jgi:hypothetical protein